MINIPRHKKDLIQAVRDQLQKQIFTKSEKIPCALAVVDKLITPEEAEHLSFSPISEGSDWGDYGKYGWFSARIPEFLDQSYAVFPDFGGEGIVYQNLWALGSVDRKHPFVFLRNHGGRALLLEVFAGGASGYEHARIGVKTAPSYQRPVFNGLSLKKMDEAVYEAFICFEMILSLLEVLQDTSLQAIKSVQALFEYSTHVNFDCFDPKLTERYLKPVLSCHNGTIAPTLYAFGQSHLDLAWLWTDEETKRKVARTYSNTLALMDKYPDYHFLCCETIILDMLESLHPSIYARVQEKIKQGRFYCEGGFYVESDTNYPSLESLITQLERGQEGFLHHAGHKSRFAWLPDCFGFSAVLPQIFRLCGLEYFSTNKLQRQDPEAQAFPFNDFFWKGMDGSRVRANMCFKNNCSTEPKNLYQRWNENRLQSEDIESLIYPFGHGDGGGGPTIDMVEMILRETDLQGLPRVNLQGPVDYFEALGPTENEFSGELYLAWHRGTFTSQHKLKSLMREAENALRDAKLSLSLRGEYQSLREIQDVILFNQFHDIISGVSLADVNDKAIRQLSDCIKSLNEITGRIDENRIDKRREFKSFEVSKDGYLISGSTLEVKINPEGVITEFSLNKRNLVKEDGQFGVLRLYEDFNPAYDAWEIGRHYKKRSVSVPQAIVRGLEDDNTTLVLSYKITEASSAEIRLRFCEGFGLCFDIDVSWHERERLLRLEFDHSLLSLRCLASNQAGYVSRPCDEGYLTSRDRFEMISQSYAALEEGLGVYLSVLALRPFGYGSLGSTLGVSLLKSSSAPDPRAEEGDHSLSFCITAAQSLSEIQKASEAFNGQADYEDKTKKLFRLSNPSIRVANVSLNQTGDLLIRLYDESGSNQETELVSSYERSYEINSSEKIEFERKLEFHPFEIKTVLLSR